MIANSELGSYLEGTKNSFNLNQVVNEKAVAYFALPALKFPDFAKVLGKLVINDIKTLIGARDSPESILVIFDEFSVFAGDQALNLVNRERGKGIHAVFGTQGLADLERVDSGFESQLLNCVNTIICHRLNHQAGAEKIAEWIGTYDSFDVTSQIDLASATLLGSLASNKAFHVHPDTLKQSLLTGEAILASKIDVFQLARLKIIL